MVDEPRSREPDLSNREPDPRGEKPDPSNREPDPRREKPEIPDPEPPRTPEVPVPEVPDRPEMPPAPRPQPEMPPAPRPTPEIPDPEPAEKPEVPPQRPGSWLAERPETILEVPAAQLATQARRDFLLLSLGLVASVVGAWWLLPDRAKGRLVGLDRRDRLDTMAARIGLSRANREKTLDRALTFDDDVAEALYSRNRRVRTYRRSDVTPLKNNYHGRTPGPEHVAGWTLGVSGLASGREERLTLDQLMSRFSHHEQVTRLVCVEGWSAIAWWGGLLFSDFLAAFPPAAGARWAAMRSSISLDGAGRNEPYYVSIDLDTAYHPQSLLATHMSGALLPLAHGAPLRLLTPVKLGLKNIKAITDVAYTREEPPDYWNEQGYSKYDGL